MVTVSVESVLLVIVALLVGVFVLLPIALAAIILWWGWVANTARRLATKWELPLARKWLSHFDENTTETVR